MEWLEFDILYVARQCGLKVKHSGYGNTEVKAQCPFCGDSKYHISLNTQTNMWICFRCGAHGNAVSLYANVCGISNGEAVKMLKQENPTRYERKTEAVKQFVKPLVERHNVYYDFLEMLTLNSEHREELIGRGLSDENIRQFMYKSYPTNAIFRSAIAEQLSRKHDLHGVPGFYVDDYGRWQMYYPKCSGYFIPVCDKTGYIQGMQLRLQSDSKRYRWFSTNGYYEGTGVSSWVHVVGNTSSDEAFLTEGALKADVSSVLLGGALFMAVPGVNAVSRLEETLTQLHIRKVYEAFDMDKVTNINVVKALIKIKEILKKNGIAVQDCKWNPIYKGIDDYSLFKKQYYSEQAA